MELNFKENGVIEINNARIIYRNFSGIGDKFTRPGDRSFSVVIPDQDICDALLDDVSEDGVAWNVKIKDANEEGQEPFRHLKVKLYFTNRGPNVYLQSGNNRVKLTEETIGCLDDIDIEKVDMDIRPYDGIANGKPFRAAYLNAMLVTQSMRFVDRFALED